MIIPPSSGLPDPMGDSTQQSFIVAEGLDGMLKQSSTKDTPGCWAKEKEIAETTTLGTVSASVGALTSEIVAMRNFIEDQAQTNHQMLRTILDLVQQHDRVGTSMSEFMKESPVKDRRGPGVSTHLRYSLDSSASAAVVQPEALSSVDKFGKDDDIALKKELSGKRATEIDNETVDVTNTCGTDFTRASNWAGSSAGLKSKGGGAPWMKRCACGSVVTADDMYCRMCGKVQKTRRTTLENLFFDHLSSFNSNASQKLGTRSGTVAFDAGPCRSFFILLAESRPFEAFCAFIIIFHTLFIGVWVEYMSTVSMKGHAVFTIGNVFLTLCFLGEIVVKVIAEGKTYLTGHEWGWNAFDLCLLSLVFIEASVGLAAQGEAKKTGKQILKVAEMVRAARVLRIFRVLKFSKTLTMILSQIINTMASLGWILVMAFMMMFTMAVCFTMGSLSLVNLDADDAMDDMTLRFRDVYRHFGTVHASLFTISAGVSGGYQWADVVSNMQQMGWLYQALFVLFVAFFAIAVLNIITGIFVDNAFGANDEMKSEHDRKKEKARSTRLKAIFRDMDVTNKGQITSEDFVGMRNDPDMVHLMNELKIPLNDAGNLFKLLDFNENGELDIHEFVSGLLRLREGSTSLDVQTLLYEGRKMKKLLAEATVLSKCCFQEIAERLMRLESRSKFPVSGESRIPQLSPKVEQSPESGAEPRKKNVVV